MPECPTCGKHLDPSVRFCPDDGTPLTETAAATAAHTPTGKPAKSRELELPLVLGNRYRLVEARGGGGMARVYKAVDVTLEREVAVKLINPDLREDPEFDTRFQREARIASQLADPHIVVVHDFGLDTTHGPYLVMEFLQGQSLRERLQSQGPLPLRAVLQLTGQLLLALIHAHDKGIVHRDIKPDNIFLLNQSGIRLHVRVLDFGIARIFRRDEPSHAETLTRPGAVLGTPRYMSPEQLAGQAVDARSDLYSAGLVIYEALTGTLPYVSHKKLTELCPDVPAAFHDVLNQCLLQNPAERPASAVEVYLRLQEPARASGVLLLPPGAMDKLAAASKAQQQPTVAYVPAAQKPWWKRRTVLGLALLVLLALLALGMFLLLKRPGGTASSARESLLGLEVGSSLYDVVAKFPGAKPRELSGNPWKGAGAEALGRVLTQDDLGDEDSLNNLKVLLWANDAVCVVLQQDVVRAVVIRAPYRAATGRGLKIHATESDLKDVYRETPASITPLAAPAGEDQANTKGSNYIEVYRYDDLGVGFEIRHNRVTAITLYPPSAAREGTN